MQSGVGQLAHLDLSGNHIGSKGGNALGGALTTNWSLKSLSLASNILGRKGSVSIERALSINMHVVVDLSNAGLDAQTQQRFDAALANRTTHSKVLHHAVEAQLLSPTTIRVPEESASKTATTKFRVAKWHAQPRHIWRNVVPAWLDV